MDAVVMNYNNGTNTRHEHLSLGGQSGDERSAMSPANAPAFRV